MPVILEGSIPSGNDPESWNLGCTPTPRTAGDCDRPVRGACYEPPEFIPGEPRDPFFTQQIHNQKIEKIHPSSPQISTYTSKRMFEARE